MSLIGAIGVILAISGVFYLRTYMQQRRWPLVQGAFDSVDVKIEATTPIGFIGVFFNPKCIQKIRYSYYGKQYIVELPLSKTITETLELRVNPKKPSEAYLDNKSLLSPILAISIGIIIILLSIRIGVD